MSKIPATIIEALDIFINSLDCEGKQALFNIKENQISKFHFSWGLLMRNKWNMWSKNTPLVNSFKEIGITHADDMSGIILRSAYRKLHKKPIKLKEQAKFYQNYWKKKIGRKTP